MGTTTMFLDGEAAAVLAGLAATAEPHALARLRTGAAATAVSTAATARVGSPVLDDASVQVTDVICRVAPDERAEPTVAGAYHIVLPHAGALACSVRGVRAARFIVDPVMALLVAPGERVAVRNALAGEHAATVLTVHPELLDLVMRTGARGGRLAAAAVVLSPLAMLHAQRVRRLAGMHDTHARRAGPMPAAPLATATLALLRDLLPGTNCERRAPGEHARRSSSSRTVAIAASVRALLAVDPGAVHSLESVSASVGLSPFHLARVFRAQTGLSIHQYLLHLRMGRALIALGEGESSLSRLALTLGFCSHSHFTTTFRRHFGTSPRSVRALLNAPPTANPLQAA